MTLPSSGSSDDGFVAEPSPRPHEDELPLWDDIVDFPEP